LFDKKNILKFIENIEEISRKHEDDINNAHDLRESKFLTLDFYTLIVDAIYELRDVIIYSETKK